jgi:hypothetical protein
VAGVSVFVRNWHAADPDSGAAVGDSEHPALRAIRDHGRLGLMLVVVRNEESSVHVPSLGA